MLSRRDVEQKVRERGYRMTDTWKATWDDVVAGSVDPYAPNCIEGDQLVSMIGYDPGSVEWTENWC